MSFSTSLRNRIIRKFVWIHFTERRRTIAWYNPRIDPRIDPQIDQRFPHRLCSTYSNRGLIFALPRRTSIKEEKNKTNESVSSGFEQISQCEIIRNWFTNKSFTFQRQFYFPSKVFSLQKQWKSKFTCTDPPLNPCASTGHRQTYKTKYEHTWCYFVDTCGYMCVILDQLCAIA